MFSALDFSSRLISYVSLFYFNSIVTVYLSSVSFILLRLVLFFLLLLKLVTRIMKFQCTKILFKAIYHYCHWGACSKLQCQGPMRHKCGRVYICVQGCPSGGVVCRRSAHHQQIEKRWRHLDLHHGGSCTSCKTPLPQSHAHPVTETDTVSLNWGITIIATHWHFFRALWWHRVIFQHAGYSIALNKKSIVMFKLHIV